MSRARSTLAALASYGTSTVAVTNVAVIDGRSVRVTSGTHGAHDWCAIGQLGFAYDGRTVRVALLVAPAVTPAVLAGRARRPMYGDAGHAATSRHRAIWDLRQSGVAAVEISRRLGVHVEMVRRILQRYRRHLAQVRIVAESQEAGSSRTRGARCA